VRRRCRRPVEQRRYQEPTYHSVMMMESINHSSFTPVAATRGVSLAKELKYLAHELPPTNHSLNVSLSLVGT